MSISRHYVLSGADPVLCGARIAAMQDAMLGHLREATAADASKGAAVVRVAWLDQMVDATMTPAHHPRAEPDVMLLTLRHLRRRNNQWTELARTGQATIAFEPGGAVPTARASELLAEASAWAAKRLDAPAPAPEGPSPGR